MVKYHLGIRKDKRGGYSYKITVAEKQKHGACVGCTTREQALAFVTQKKT